MSLSIAYMYVGTLFHTEERGSSANICLHSHKIVDEAAGYYLMVMRFIDICTCYCTVKRNLQIPETDAQLSL